MDEARRVESYPNYNLAYLAKRLTGVDYQEEMERDGRYAITEMMNDPPSFIYHMAYLECISVNISYLSRMISQYRARHSYKKVYKAVYKQQAFQK